MSNKEIISKAENIINWYEGQLLSGEELSVLIAALGIARILCRERFEKTTPDEYKCRNCSHFLGMGDWSLCCDLRHDLCYEDTEACGYDRRMP